MFTVQSVRVLCVFSVEEIKEFKIGGSGFVSALLLSKTSLNHFKSASNVYSVRSVISLVWKNSRTFKTSVSPVNTSLHSS